MLTTVCNRIGGAASMRTLGKPLFLRFSTGGANSTSADKKVTPPPKPETVGELEKKKKQLVILAQALSDSEEKLKKTQQEMDELKKFGNMKFAKEMLEVMDNIEQLQGYMLVKLIIEATRKAPPKAAPQKKAAETPKIVVPTSSAAPKKDTKGKKDASTKDKPKEAPKMSETEQMCSALNIIAKDFAMRLTRQGISPIPDPIGKKFDPRYHNAVVELAKSAVDGGGRMTAVPPSSSVGSGSGNFTVRQVMKRGYMFKGRLLRPANVAVSRDDQKTAGGKK